jgi:hypothetical protein
MDEVRLTPDDVGVLHKCFEFVLTLDTIEEEDYEEVREVAAKLGYKVGPWTKR